MDKELLKVDQMLQLESVLPYDKELAVKHDLPDDKLKTVPSSVLCRHFFRSPLRVWFGLYDERNMGITRALRGSKTLAELYSRADMLDGMLEFYRASNDEIPSNQKDAGEISMSLLVCDELLMYPPVFSKAKGREKEILNLLCRRYQLMTEANRLAGKNAPYGASFESTKQLALGLIKQIDSTRNWVPPKIEQELAWYKEIEHLCH
jgi:hypothetical protein